MKLLLGGIVLALLLSDSRAFEPSERVRSEEADVPQPCGLRPEPPETTVPKWVKELNAVRK
jgi:hypothetical protein